MYQPKPLAMSSCTSQPFSIVMSVCYLSSFKLMPTCCRLNPTMAKKNYLNSILSLRTTDMTKLQHSERV